VELDSPITREFAGPGADSNHRRHRPSLSCRTSRLPRPASLPDKLIRDSSGHYIDVDIYGTINFTNDFGAQIGYRS
jgi:hypothetical protein